MDKGYRSTSVYNGQELKYTGIQWTRARVDKYEMKNAKVQICIMNKGYKSTSVHNGQEVKYTGI